ncbi:hypothetical protein J8J14_11895 [Roseomonas sp. SSH11]|uniref:Tripartite tricarboxylate transporter substrate binding protein n=1 Tax=Pararoseomonas baculiformis TaxID=2820812 RepID=A0ABS4AG26_9PROT|nr:tripartite tricarboxylate transporter substrate-binding protein [Pararoseomonas baculiformis]MBP0445480.1 hypothetical protein [Pararoseomonas baculiformis]
MRRRHLPGLIAGLALSSGRVSAEGRQAGPASPWRPAHTIRLIVPVAPGGSQDATARILARPLSERLGQPVVVDNLPGAAGNVGFHAAARARPDGHTLLAGSDGLSINKTLFPRLDFDPVEGFVAVSWVVRVPQILVVRAGRGWAAEGMAGFLREVGRRPVTMGTTGIGSLAHLLGEEMQEAIGARWIHVPYRGGAPAVTDVVAGVIDAALVNIGAAAVMVRNGMLQGLLVSSPNRVGALPAVPSIIATGPLAEGAVGWHGIVAPVGTPGDVIAALDAAVQAVLASDSLRSQLLSLGHEPVSERPERLAQVIRADAARWGSVIRRKGIAPA